MSPAHVPQLPFEPHPHPLFLPCLILPTFALSRSITAARARQRRALTVQATQSSRLCAKSPRASSRGKEPSPHPSYPDYFPSAANLRSLELYRAGSARPHDVRPIQPRPFPCFGPRCSSPLTGASTSLGAPDSPSPQLGLLAGVTPTRLKLSLCHSLVSSLVLTAETPPSSSSGPSLVLANSSDLGPPEVVLASAPVASPPRMKHHRP
jgi:hypothetical protein